MREWHPVHCWYLVMYESTSIPSPSTQRSTMMLMPARLMFFESVARQFDQFLVRYQMDKPMVPILSGDLDVIVRGLCQRFMKQSVLDAATSTPQLAKLNIYDVDSHLPHSQIDPGFCAAKKLKELAAVTSVKQKLSERERMAFRMECKTGLVCATQKLLEKCPITYTMTRNPRLRSLAECCTSCQICTKSEMRIAMLSSSSSGPL